MGFISAVGALHQGPGYINTDLSANVNIDAIEINKVKIKSVREVHVKVLQRIQEGQAGTAGLELKLYAFSREEEL